MQLQPITTCVTICDYHEEKNKKTKTNSSQFITRIASHPRNNSLIAGILEILVSDQVMITKREQLGKLSDQLSKHFVRNKIIQPQYILPACLQFLWIQLPSFTNRFIYESSVSYHLIWHITPTKTHTVTAFSLECCKT